MAKRPQTERVTISSNSDTVPGRGRESREEVAGELLQAKVTEAGSLLGHYIRALALYIAVMGALVKFALDKDSTPELKSALTLLGSGLSVLGFIACALGQLVARKLLHEMKQLSEIIGLPAPRTSVLPLEFTVLMTALFVAVAMATWIYAFRW